MPGTRNSRANRFKKCSFLLDPNKQSCFLKERKSINKISDSAHYHLYWDNIKKEYLIPKRADAITLKNGITLNSKLEYGLRRVRKYACCCYGLNDQTSCFGLSVLIIFFALLFLNITVMISRGIFNLVTTACLFGSVIAFLFLQVVLILIWYFFNMIRACLIQEALTSLNRETGRWGRCKWSSSGLATRLSVFVEDPPALTEIGLKSNPNSQQSIRTPLNKGGRRGSQPLGDHQSMLGSEPLETHQNMLDEEEENENEGIKPQGERKASNEANMNPEVRNVEEKKLGTEKVEKNEEEKIIQGNQGEGEGDKHHPKTEEQKDPEPKIDENEKIEEGVGSDKDQEGKLETAVKEQKLQKDV